MAKKARDYKLAEASMVQDTDVGIDSCTSTHKSSTNQGGEPFVFIGNLDINGNNDKEIPMKCRYDTSNNEPLMESKYSMPPADTFLQPSSDQHRLHGVLTPVEGQMSW